MKENYQIEVSTIITAYKVLTKEELSTFFNVIENYKFKTIFMLVYGSGLRIGEVVNLRVEDIDSKKMRIFVREGKGNLARYEKYLGGEIGFFSILHTWGQNLMYHPHVHLVVTGGGGS